MGFRGGEEGREKGQDLTDEVILVAAIGLAESRSQIGTGQAKSLDLEESHEHPRGGTDRRHAMIQQLSVQFPVEELCKVLEVSRSGYYRRKRAVPSRRENENQKLLAEIVRVHQEHQGRYGSPRIVRVLKANGMACSENTVLIMPPWNPFGALSRRKPCQKPESFKPSNFLGEVHSSRSMVMRT